MACKRLFSALPFLKYAKVFCDTVLENRRFRLISLSLLFTAGGVTAFSFSALAQSDIHNRIGRIEKEIETLSRTVYRGEAPPPGALAGGSAAQAANEIRIQQLETELREARGRLEEQSHEIRLMRDRLDKALSDIEMRVSDVEKGGGASSSSQIYTGGSMTRPQVDMPQPAHGGGGAAEGSLGTLSVPAGGGLAGATDMAAVKYENAFALLKNAQYDGAASGFQEFISQYPDHVLVSNAKYWLGETYYVRGSFKEAARIFAEAYQQAPKGAKAADNLLKLGLSLAGMGNKSDACVALAQVGKEFPAGSTPVLRRAEQEMANLGCN